MNTEIKTHCQICSRFIRLTRGTIALHGYQRPYQQGWQTSSCFGAQWVSYEEGHDALDKLIPILVQQKTGVDASIEAMLREPPASVSYSVKVGRGYLQKTETRTAERPEGFVHVEGRFQIDQNGYAYQYQKLLSQRRSTSRGLGVDIEALKQRRAAWKEAA